MEYIIEIVSSPAWWVTAVVAGILINIASGYIKDALDNLLSKSLQSWRERSEKSRRENLAYIEKLKNDTGFMRLHNLKLSRARAFCTIYLILGATGFVSSVAMKSHSLMVYITFMTIASLAALISLRYLAYSERLFNCSLSALERNDT